MDWGRLILQKALRVTIGFASGILIVCLFRSFGPGAGGFSLGGLVAQVTAFFTVYAPLLAIIWIVLVIVEVIRARGRSTGK